MQTNLEDRIKISLGTSTTEFRILAVLNELHNRYKNLNDGKVADYIPELSKMRPGLFGISVVTTAGKTYEVGDTGHHFTAQSVSKPFVYGLALEDHGRDFVRSKVGVEPTGDAFNSIIKLDETSKRPHNPMVNAGAIAVASLIRGDGPTSKLNHLLDMFNRYTGRPMGVDMPVFMSERTSGHRNRAIAHLMLNFGMVNPDIDIALDLYFQQCSVSVTCHDLAVMAATLANKGVNPFTGVQAINPEYVRDILSLMFTCGMYDYSGEWAYTVGLPAKSGVGGGILCVVPKRMGIAVFSPPLDARGNSVRGIRVFEDLSRIFRLHVFDSLMGDTGFDDMIGDRPGPDSAAKIGGDGRRLPDNARLPTDYAAASAASAVPSGSY